MSSLYSVSQIITIPFIPIKSQVLKFLGEVYQNILIRSNNIFNIYTFQEIVNIPMIIAEKIYLALTNYTYCPITSFNFSTGIYSLLFGTSDQKIKTIFHILDFDNDSTVNYVDLFLILAHFHMINNGGESIDLLRSLLEDFIQRDEELDKEAFIERCKNKNCDIAVLMIFFINRYMCFFDEEEVKYFGDYCYEEYNDKDNTDVDINDMSGINAKISQRLQKYFEVTQMVLKQRKSIVTYDKISNNMINQCNKDCTCNEEDDDFDELNNFEKDLTDIMSSKKNEKDQAVVDIHLSETFDYNCNSSLVNPTGIKRKDFKEFSSKLSISPKMQSRHYNSKITKLNTSSVPYQLCYTKSTNEISTNEDSAVYHSNNKIKSSIFEIAHQSSLFSEIVLLQGSPSSNIQCKVVITHSFCFVFTLLNNQSIYSKTLPLTGLFVKTGTIELKKSTFYEIKLISNIHNHVIDYFFYTTNEEHMQKVKALVKRKTSVDSIEDKFSIIKELGRGKFGQVYLIEDKLIKGCFYAMKTVKKKCGTEEEYKINRWESSIFIFLTKLKHPNVIECFEYYETDENIYYLSEYIKGGDLKTYIKSNTNISSETIVDISLQIINGVSCLHQYGIIHRDIKTTNILIERDIKLDEVNVKLIDFGLSRILGAYEKSNDPYGSLSFKAPELLLHFPYNFKVDIWAVGITIYYLIFRTLPYEKGTKQQIKFMIINKEINFPLDQVNFNLSSDYSFLFALIGECLEKNVNNRPSIDRIMQKYYDKYQL